MQEKHSLFHPRYWIFWLVIGLLRVLILLPYPAQLKLGRGLGHLIRHTAKRRRIITEYNLERCFPDRTPEERRRLARKHFEAMGIALFEVGMCWWASARRLRRLVQIEGIQHLEKARAKGRGVILLSAHVTTLEIGGRLLGLFTDFHLMYKPNRNPVLERVIRGRREAHFDRAIPTDDVRLMLKSLKEGFPVWYAPDQGYLGKGSAMVPFFGVPAPTHLGTSRFAKISGAPVLPFFVERLPGTAGYRLEIRPPLEGFPSDDPEADAARVNQVIEDQARLTPEQYLWAHNRFKTDIYRKYE